MEGDNAVLAAAQRGDTQAFERLVAPYRRELRSLCYRMAGSLHDADDLLQESLVRVWRGLASFEGRARLRTWLYTVTTRACLDTLDKRSARFLPLDLGPPADASTPIGPPRLDPIWLEPCPESVYDAPATPEARYTARESVALAFLVALQALPPRQRAVLLLRDVLGWQANECAELLEMSVAAVNSALQRARETLDARPPASNASLRAPDDPHIADLLVRYVAAWERADVPALVSLLHQDATLCMPPLAEWMKGADAIGASIGAMVLTPGAAGRFKLVATRANGLPAFAAFQRDATNAWTPAALHVLGIEGDRIASIVAFVDPTLFGHFGAPPAPV